ncbi:uncharacterized protein M421DRAFT_3559 [Didymella exigua CBS 183.55]|uniref:Myb-like domain-containing protein n=1 Tax=Didymella exigua CBS 183.55 TaxID=1150837 RepID=A0A6A5RQ91_9PLEO|nr:uncharacterized protein M421DRAFT_3559 [Didymella exigua CBS 183.55]KAF1930505.1 hypothetical protein M421DRAFT_3559 [Didymella exigua CBS 183.55]
MSHQPSASYNVGYSSTYQTTAAGRKRNHQEHQMQPELPPLEQHLNPYGQATGSVSLAHPSQQGYSLHQYPLPPQAPQQQHTLPPTHHHHLPNTHRSKRQQMEGAPPSPTPHQGPPSVVGAQGMPAPAPRPRGPKLKFTPEDDQLLVDLKEKKNLTWKQIADFFPGRSSGTLQVVKLRTSMQEYENDKWRIISSKVGAGFSPAACKDKVEELRAIETEQEEECERQQQQSVYVQSEMPGGQSDPSASYQ